MEEKKNLRQKHSAADKETVEEVASDSGDETVVVAKEVLESPEKKPTKGKKSGRRRNRGQKPETKETEASQGDGQETSGKTAETPKEDLAKTGQTAPEKQEGAASGQNTEQEQTATVKGTSDEGASADGATEEGTPEVSEAAAVSSSAYKALELERDRYKAQVEEAGDRYKRLLAEFENARNRNEKESKRMYDVGAKEVLEKLLPVVDNFERALQAIPEGDKERPFEKGVDQIYKQLVKTLNDVGVQPMNAEGTQFDPNLHNAVMHIEDEAFGENVVTEELQKGYMYKEDVLRHSMVKVAN